MPRNVEAAKADRLAGPIFVTGVWKSGNHLVYSALNEMGISGPFNGIAAHLLFGRHRWAKQFLRGPLKRIDSVQVGLETDAQVSRRYIAKEARRLSGKILGGHAAYTPELEAILNTSHARKICIRRDPRDILVSFSDWVGTRPDYFLHNDFVHLSREQRVRLLLRGGEFSFGKLYPFPEVLRRASGWLNVRDILQISFEDLIGPVGGGDPTKQAEALTAIHAHVGAPVPLEQVNADSIYGGSLTFNKGRSQRWRELDSVDLVDEIGEVLGPFLTTWGYAE